MLLTNWLTGLTRDRRLGLRLRRFRHQSRANHTGQLTRKNYPLAVELLEDRTLLSTDFLLGANFAAGLARNSTAQNDRQAGIEKTGSSTRYHLPDLPGMVLVDPQASTRNAVGQIIYLDFDGAEDVIYNGPITVGPFDVPAFQAPGELAGQEEAIIGLVVEQLEQTFAGSGVIFTTEQPADGVEYSTIYIGGDDSAFREYGSFLGLAEQIDVSANSKTDNAFVFQYEHGSTVGEYASATAATAAHEVAHLLGYDHDEEVEPRSILDPVAHKAGPDDGGDVKKEAPVHQYITDQAYRFYNSQFEGSELSSYIGSVDDWSHHHESDGIDNDIIEGAFDEDVSHGFMLRSLDFHHDIAWQNPFNQWSPYYRHFVAGGDVVTDNKKTVDQLMVGIGDPDLPFDGEDAWKTDDPDDTFFSAYEQAQNYWTGNGLFKGLVSIYNTNPSTAYYYLGHVAHLLEDTTVPAHTHLDAHGSWVVGDDTYERWVGSGTNYERYGIEASVTPNRGWDIELPKSLVALFRYTAKYTSDYDSDDVHVRGYQFDPGVRAPNRHRPDDARYPEGSIQKAQIIGDDLMPFAMEQVASLFRLFYRHVDQSDPVVNPVNGLSSDPSSPTVFLISSPIFSAYAASDPESGVDRDGYRFKIEKQVDGQWWPYQWIGPTTRDDGKASRLPDGVYRVSVYAKNGAGREAQSAYRYFKVDATPPTPTVNIQQSVLNRGHRTSRVTITFDEPVTGFSIGDLTASHGTLSNFSGSDSSYEVTFTADDDFEGTGSVTVGTGYQDLAGHEGNSGSGSVGIDTRNPTADIVDVSPDPRSTSVGSVTVTFSESVTGVDISDFSLTRDGSPVSLSGVTVSGSGSRWRLDNLFNATASSGTYVLTLNASGSLIEDSAGNPLSGDASDEWTANISPAVIRGIKWWDKNGDGVRNLWEPGLPGWTIYLDENQNGQLDWTDVDGDGQWDEGEGERWVLTQGDDPATPVEDEAGTYVFTAVQPGTYSVAEVVLPGWSQTFPTFSNRFLSDGEDPSISADGRFVAFASYDDLVSGDTNGNLDIYVYDRQTDLIERVSVANDGTEGNSYSGHPSISADGRFVAFESNASNLVPDDTNDAQDIFVYDRQTDQIERVSVDWWGGEAFSGSEDPSISADGRFVAFTTQAPLDPTDTNGKLDIYVYDRQKQQHKIERVSVASDGTQAVGDSAWPSISADGRFVAFASVAMNLVPGDTTGSQDIFVYDRLTGQIERVTQADGDSAWPSISADGRFVAFASGERYLVPGDTNGYSDIFVYDRATGQIERVSVASDGTEANDDSGHPSISADGRFMAFVSAARNLVPGDTNHGSDVFVHDRQTGQTERVSVLSDGTQPTGGSEPSISADGRFIAHRGVFVAEPVSGTHPVRLHPGQTVTGPGLAFGNQVSSKARGQISGTKWLDLDGDGLQDPYEPGVADTTIYLDENWNGQLDWWDTNRNGQWDDGEGERWVLTQSDDPNTPKDESGWYSFTDLLPGMYMVAEVVEAGWSQTYPPPRGPHVIALAPGQIVTDIDFGNRPTPAEVHGVKWHDLDGNGVRDRGEPGLADWTIYLDENGNGQLDWVDWNGNDKWDDGEGERWVPTQSDDPTTPVDETGWYSFDLLPGAYIVAEEAQAGWRQMFPAAPGKHLVELAPGETVWELDFGNQQLGEVHGMKWADLDGNGVRDRGEPGLAGWTIYLDENWNGQLDWIDTNGNGQWDDGEGERWVLTESDDPATPLDEAGWYSFTDLPPDTYTVAEVVEAGWSPTFPPLPGTHVVALKPGQIVSDIDFGNAPLPGEVHGMKWADLDGDGVRDPGEPGLGGWIIYLDENGNGHLDWVDRNGNGKRDDGESERWVMTESDDPTTPADESGLYFFADLEPGTYIVAELVGAGWNQTFPAAPGTHVVTLGPGGQIVGGIDFGNAPSPGEVHGTKWNDLNGDGVQDPGEPGLAGWTIYLDENGNGHLDAGERSVLTQSDDPTTPEDETGRYSFTDLLPGVYTVAEVQKAGWRQTFPGAPGTHLVLLGPGQIVGGIDFGNTQLPPGEIHGTKWSDLNADGVRDPGEPGLAGWRIYLDINQNRQLDWSDGNGNGEWDYGEGEPWVLTKSNDPTTPEDETGRYSFTGLPPGTYTVAEVPQVGWSQTFPAAPGTHAVALAPGQIVTDIDFGNIWPNPWQNGMQPYDVNADGYVTPLDALLVINYLNMHGAGALPDLGGERAPAYYDVTGDSFVTPLDALYVINKLNRTYGSGGEGEAPVQSLFGAAASLGIAPAPDETVSSFGMGGWPRTEAERLETPGGARWPVAAVDQGARPLRPEGSHRRVGEPHDAWFASLEEGELQLRVDRDAMSTDMIDELVVDLAEHIARAWSGHSVA